MLFRSESPLVVQVEQVGEGTRLSAIIHLMERAAAEKPKIVEMADRIASYFVAALLLVAVAVAVGWYFVEPSRALWITVSVLVVTCPCALSLATPIALTVAAGALAKDGLLVTRGHAIETLARATHFVFDKTGTLTTGGMRLWTSRCWGHLTGNSAWLGRLPWSGCPSTRSVGRFVWPLAKWRSRWRPAKSLPKPGRGWAA